MGRLAGRLGTLTARDIMTEKLVVLNETDTIQHAASVFRDLAISGAPVIDARGLPVGLLSVADIIPAVAARMGSARGVTPPISREAEWEDVFRLLNAEATGDAAGAGEQVAHWMSRRLVSCFPETPLVEVARILCEGHWHRITVVDSPGGKLKGIVSTMDVLAAIVAAADEAAPGDS
jgi:CBS domain-containing protein